MVAHGPNPSCGAFKSDPQRGTDKTKIIDLIKHVMYLPNDPLILGKFYTDLLHNQTNPFFFFGGGEIKHKIKNISARFAHIFNTFWQYHGKGNQVLGVKAILNVSD